MLRGKERVVRIVVGVVRVRVRVTFRVMGIRVEIRLEMNWVLGLEKGEEQTMIF